MFCDKCGAKIADGNIYCDNCGCAVMYNAESNSSTNASENQNYNANNMNYASDSVKQEFYQDYYQGIPNGYNQNAAIYGSNMKYPNSYFDGTMFQLIGWNLLCGLISIITLGFGGPWTICLKIRWETKHTVYNGKRLYFNGTAPQLFGKIALFYLALIGIYILICLLSWLFWGLFGAGGIVIEVILFLASILFSGAFYEVYIKKWITEHTTLVDDVNFNYLI